MKVEDIKVGTKLKFKSLKSCPELKTLFETSVHGSNFHLYVSAKAVFEVDGIDTKYNEFHLKLFSWDKSATYYDVDSYFAMQRGDATLSYQHVNLFEEYIEEHIEENHSGMVYNPYSNSWSFL